MNRSEELKQIVRDKYSQIAEQDKALNQPSCGRHPDCGAGDASTEVYNIMTDDYSQLKGYNQEADLGLGCGLPTQFARIRPGDTVIDLGSGAGNDCFVARHETGETGKVIGIDFTEAMIRKARMNAEKLGFHNVEFRQGDIEDMPVSDNIADVVVSNCVLNLVPDKQKVFTEIFRVLKPGGHFGISDIVLVGDLPEPLQKDAEMYAGCVSGAIQKEEYVGYIRQQGFEHITLQKEKPIIIPDDILSKYLSAEEISVFKNKKMPGRRAGISMRGIFSITVFAQKPVQKQGKPEAKTAEGQNNACAPGSGCC